MHISTSIILNQCANILDTVITSVKTISGGDINEARLLQTKKGKYFLKFNTQLKDANMFSVEAKGLGLLEAPNILRTPKVIHIADHFLLLEYVEPVDPTPKFWETFGHRLALLHKESQSQFGLDHANFIGRLPQSNTYHNTWKDFYIEERLGVQLGLAIENQRLGPDFIGKFERLYHKLEDICPVEPPALTHGDLWNGNFMCTTNEEAILIDPAISFTHREMDLAMSKLFGGFSPLFYESYYETYPWENGLEERIPIYQLYYLMVHVNMFGGSYVGSVRRVLDAYR